MHRPQQRPRKEILQNLLITDAGAEGKAVAKHNGMVIFIPFGAPGDIVDVEIIFKKKTYAEGRIIKIVSQSPFRIDPFCKHFGVCGGCRWQHLDYRQQISAKQKHVIESLERIGKVKDAMYKPIIAAEKDRYYRNKLEFTFADRRWLTSEEINAQIEYTDQRSLGFHIPGRFDKIIDVEECFLQEDVSNQIRLKTKQFAIEHDLEFFNLWSKKGLVRNLIIRNNRKGDFMVILVVYEEKPEVSEAYISYITKDIPQISSLYIAVNNKQNDSMDDVPFVHIWGKKYIEEEIDGLIFRIHPSSFFQTNTDQAIKLYHTAMNMIEFTGSEIAYDLYSGTGTIAALLSRKVKKVIGIEYSKEAVSDGKANLKLNNIDNVQLFNGDMAKILDFKFARKYGFPDVIFTDPPRSGMVPKVMNSILEIYPKDIIYISCNPATQARDIAECNQYYDVVQVQAVDMFPHTHHVENIVHLRKKEQ